MATVWFITGSSRGLGRALVEYALEKGDRVIATARSTDTLQDLIAAYGDKDLALLQLDVTDYNAAQKTAALAQKKFGKVDIIINNAGYANLGSVENTDVKEFHQQVETNFYGTYNVSKAFIPILRQQSYGHIFQISSIGGRASSPGLSAYQAAKWAVNGFSGVLAKELSPFGINVTTLEPGFMRTDWAGSSMTRTLVTEGYQSTVGSHSQRLIDIAKDDSFKCTDPSLVGSVIWEIFIHKGTKPVRLPLGQDAVNLAASLSKAQRESDEQWADLGRSTTGASRSG